MTFGWIDLTRFNRDFSSCTWFIYTLIDSCFDCCICKIYNSEVSFHPAAKYLYEFNRNDARASSKVIVLVSISITLSMFWPQVYLEAFLDAHNGAFWRK